MSGYVMRWATCQAFWPAMIGLCKELINLVTLKVTFMVKGHDGIHPFLFHHTSFDIPIETRNAYESFSRGLFVVWLAHYKQHL